MTKLFHDLLRKLVSNYEQEALTRWYAGKLLPPEDQEMRGRVRMANDLIDIPFEDVAGVLGLDNPPTDETQDDEEAE